MTEISLQSYSEQIESLIEQGHYEEAVAHGRHILKQYPKNVAAYRLLGKAMLEANEDDEAFDMFNRVLSVDPEDLIARVGISEIHDQRDELDAAIWHLERAFEVASESEVGIVEEELRHLYGRQYGVEPERVQLTRGALARLYLRGDLLSRAIREFRDLLTEQPERVDLSVALAEALWRNGQRLEAVEVCQQVLDQRPYCLKANLILGGIWASSGREEGQTYLQRAGALDPQNRMAQELFGAASPLPAREVSIVPLEYEPETTEERPAWMADMEPRPGAAVTEAEGEVPAFGVTAGIEAPIEIPSWLEELSEEEIAPAEPLEERLPEQAVPASEGEIPEWLEGLGEGEPEEVGEEEPQEVAAEEIPEWLVGLDIEPPATEMEEKAPEAPVEPDVEAAGEEAVPSAPPAELPPDWLDGLREQIIEEGEMPEEPALPTTEEAPTPPWLEGEEMPSGEEALAWLEQLTAGREEELEALAEEEAEARMAAIMGRPEPEEVPAEAPPIEEAPAPPTEEVPVAAAEEVPPVAPAAEEPTAPTWLESEEMPSGEEALAWLEQLTAGKEAELEALAEEEAGARMAAIMGRPEPAEVPAEAPPIEEAPTPPTEEVPVAAAEEAPPVAEAAPAAEEPTAPAWLEREEMPSGEEALAWLEQLTAGKEAELEALAEEEAGARMAAIMGRAEPEEAPSEVFGAPAVEEAPPEAPVAPPVEEPFGWTAFGEPEEPPPTVEVEHALPTEEVEETMGHPKAAEAPAAGPVVEEVAEAPPTEAPLETGGAPPTEAPLETGGAPPTEAPSEVSGAPPAEAPSEEAGAPPIEEALPEAPAAPPIEEPFGWTAFGEPEAPAPPVAEAGEAPPVELVGETAQPEMAEMAREEEVEFPPAPEFAPPGEPEEVPTAEIAPPIEEARWGADWEAPTGAEVAPTPVVEEVPGVDEMEAPPPIEEPVAPEEEALVVEAPVIEETHAESLDNQRAYLKEHRRDYEAWLALARALWQADEQQEALEAYSRVIGGGKLLDGVIADMETHVEDWPDPSAQRVLGDAYMKDGQLQKALAIYRQALETL